MMAFADWKKRSKLYKETINRHTFAWPDIEDACAAAYKAGQRDGMKVAEVVAQNAIALRFKLGQKAWRWKWQK